MIFHENEWSMKKGISGRGTVANKGDWEVDLGLTEM